MSVKHRVSQIIKISDNSCLLLQTVLGEKDKDMCSISSIKNKRCLLYIYNRNLCLEFLCSSIEREDGTRIRYIKLDYRIYLFK